LIKYFHKYHKYKNEHLNGKYEELLSYYKTTKKQIKEYSETESLVSLVGYESQAAIKYWSYIRELLKDDGIDFFNREHKGATDLVNSMLNYGYAILYTRVWQALLAAKLNPYDSIIHVRQSGKPTFVYDVVEIFRSQVVDRVVISLIQKKRKLKIENNLLDNETRCILAKNILERLNRYEKYHGEEITMEEIIFRQAKEIALWIDKDIRYKPYIAKW
jgi:CRISPR-associated endonuclease Cas1